MTCPLEEKDDNQNIINTSTRGGSGNNSYTDKTIDNSTDIEKGDTDFEENKYIIRRKVDKENHRYPFCIVWTPLPLISWILPCIGHTGICTYIVYINI